MKERTHRGIALMDGEEVEAVLDLQDGLAEAPSADAEQVVLTDRRVIYIRGNGARRRSTFAAVQDVRSVEVSVQPEVSAFIWGGIALVVALVLWRTVDHPVGSVVSAVVVALMGVYLVVDQLLAPSVARVVFRLSGSEVRCDLKGEGAMADVYPFINRLFQVKGDGLVSGPGRRPFAPR